MDRPTGARLFWRRGWVALAFAPFAYLTLAGSQDSNTQEPGRTDPAFLRVQASFRASCISCHGTDGAGGLNLTTYEGIRKAVKPGDPEHSVLLRRIHGLDGLPRMPMGFAPLPKAQIDAIEAWVRNGALPGGAAATHWSYTPIVAPEVPDAPDAAAARWIRNPIDNFVVARLRKEGLKPNPAADPATLCRRVYLDIIGLPPTLAELDAFLADRRPDAYETLVDALLARPEYGERQARIWLDLARYADSNGFEKDLNRTAWPYRDWVINAFNSNMPYDRFTIEQLAGDLLPHPTRSQLVATGFNRNTMFNQEGGVDPYEGLYAVILDRVGATSTVWLGSTLQCAQCHDHKYDPFSQRDFYRMYAFFNAADYDERGPRLASENKFHEPSIAADLSRNGELIRQAERRLAFLRAQLRRKAAADKPARDAWIAADPLRDYGKDEAQRTDLYANEGEVFAPIRQAIAETQGRMDALLQGIPTTLVMRDRSDRYPLRAPLHHRGEFVSPGEPVDAGTPAFLPPMRPNEPANRLGLAEWIMDPENPLTARVQVNRMWENYFGRGIVESSEDFGTQMTPPTHPELLDWLASEFRDGGWNLKAIHRLIITSATYRQSSAAPAEAFAHDPRNQFLARGPRFRMEAEMIRDSALSISGLLVKRVGGPSVMPQQPEGIWNTPYNGETWVEGKGDDRHRRSIYTFLKRTSPFPQQLVFDGTSRESCTVRRIRTNTPLQALAQMNDPAVMESAQALGSAMQSAASDDRGRLIAGFRACTSRTPNAAELVALGNAITRFRSDYAQRPDAAAKLAKDPESAAWTMLGSLLLNLDETITIE